MRLTSTPGRKALVAAAGVVAALGVGGTAYAASDGGSGTPALVATNGGAVLGAPVHPKGAHRTLLRRADHATAEVRVKGQWVTYTLDRGKVSAVSPTSITLALPDGHSVTDTIGSGTKFGGVSSEAGVQPGRPASVVSLNGMAVRIRQADHPAPPATGSGS